LKVNHGRRHPGHLRQSSLLYIPGLHGPALQQANQERRGAVDQLDGAELTRGDERSVWHMVIYTLLIMFFTYFYVSITFNPDRGRRQHEAVRRLHARLSARVKPTAEYLRLRAQPHHRCPARCTWP
jgi:preprotein translocase subunit SecY